MKIELRWGVLAVAAALSLPFVACAQDVKAGGGEPAQASPATDQQKREAQKEISAKKKELAALGKRADDVTKSIGKLASSGKLGHDQDSLKAMQDMVDELKAIHDRLDQMQEEIDGIEEWISGEKKTRPKFTQDVDKANAHKVSNYVQFQYNNTDKVGGSNDAFRMRRVRLGFTDKVAPNASMKVSVDLATGTNQLNAQLKDAFLTYDLAPKGATSGTQAIFGQMALPIGYELERSSSVREFPERSQYNLSLFGGERGRGVMLQHGLDQHTVVHAGVWNALTISDPEQSNLAPGPDNKLGFTAGVRYEGSNYEVGLSGFAATRPAYTSGTPAMTAPQVDRRFLYFDGQFEKLFVPQMFLRTEAMIGNDRVPSATASPTNVNHGLYGYHVILGYNIDPKNQLSLKYEEFDPNRDAGGDLFRGWGVAYNYYLAHGVRFTAAQEFFQDDSRSGAPTNQKRYGMTTFRIQFKF